MSPPKTSGLHTGALTSKKNSSVGADLLEKLEPMMPHITSLYSPKQTTEGKQSSARAGGVKSNRSSILDMHWRKVSQESKRSMNNSTKRFTGANLRSERAKQVI
mmetsp:Transcript_45684/g.60562  ORF Transcript_45684/g.60562 Transcript_45684/m.60562 type:complete len:104 (+) Transcript_45684:559-870(+)